LWFSRLSDWFHMILLVFKHFSSNPYNNGIISPIHVCCTCKNYCIQIKMKVYFYLIMLRIRVMKVVELHFLVIGVNRLDASCSIDLFACQTKSNYKRWQPCQFHSLKNSYKWLKIYYACTLGVLYCLNVRNKWLEDGISFK
jgi:hypothetical protein